MNNGIASVVNSGNIHSNTVDPSNPIVKGLIPTMMAIELLRKGISNYGIVNARPDDAFFLVKEGYLVSNRAQTLRGHHGPGEEGYQITAKGQSLMYHLNSDTSSNKKTNTQ